MYLYFIEFRSSSIGSKSGGSRESRVKSIISISSFSGDEFEASFNSTSSPMPSSTVFNYRALLPTSNRKISTTNDWCENATVTPEAAEMLELKRPRSASEGVIQNTECKSCLTDNRRSRTKSIEILVELEEDSFERDLSSLPHKSVCLKSSNKSKSADNIIEYFRADSMTSDHFSGYQNDSNMIHHIRGTSIETPTQEKELDNADKHTSSTFIENLSDIISPDENLNVSLHDKYLAQDEILSHSDNGDSEVSKLDVSRDSYIQDSTLFEDSDTDKPMTRDGNSESSLETASPNLNKKKYNCTSVGSYDSSNSLDNRYCSPNMPLKTIDSMDRSNSDDEYVLVPPKQSPRSKGTSNSLFYVDGPLSSEFSVKISSSSEPNLVDRVNEREDKGTVNHRRFYFRNSKPKSITEGHPQIDQSPQSTLKNGSCSPQIKHATSSLDRKQAFRSPLFRRKKTFRPDSRSTSLIECSKERSVSAPVSMDLPILLNAEDSYSNKKTYTGVSSSSQYNDRKKSLDSEGRSSDHDISTNVTSSFHSGTRKTSFDSKGCNSEHSVTTDSPSLDNSNTRKTSLDSKKKLSSTSSLPVAMPVRPDELPLSTSNTDIFSTSTQDQSAKTPTKRWSSVIARFKGSPMKRAASKTGFKRWNSEQHISVDSSTPSPNRRTSQYFHSNSHTKSIEKSLAKSPLANDNEVIEEDDNDIDFSKSINFKSTSEKKGLLGKFRSSSIVQSSQDKREKEANVPRQSVSTKRAPLKIMSILKQWLSKHPKVSLMFVNFNSSSVFLDP